MAAGYSGTPLATKLGIKPSSTLLVVNDPGHFDEIVAPLPPGVARRKRASRGGVNVVVLFVRSRGELDRRIDVMTKAVFPDGGVWVAWPKRASGIPTDMTEDVIREVVLPMGLVDNKVCAIDETWSGLRVVWRRERR
ncbi:MAG: DUF3052 family protein [Acidimicrobiia bacterium]|nr:DUF3052 family protein [Acidimicrobiia bacterium]